MQKLLNYCNTPLLAVASLAAFAWLAYFSDPYGGDRGYDPAVSARIGAMAVAPIARHKPAMTSEEKRAALVELFGENVK
jgi:hypothetical protein